MSCPNPIELQSFADGELNSRRHQSINQHLQVCPACRQIVGDFEQLTALLNRVSDTVVYPPNRAVPKRLAGRSTIWAAAAAIILIVSVSGWWFGWRQTDSSDLDTQLVLQCLELHDEARL